VDVEAHASSRSRTAHECSSGPPVTCDAMGRPSELLAELRVHRRRGEDRQRRGSSKEHRVCESRAGQFGARAIPNRVPEMTATRLRGPDRCRYRRRARWGAGGPLSARPTGVVRTLSETGYMGGFLSGGAGSRFSGHSAWWFAGGDQRWRRRPVRARARVAGAVTVGVGLVSVAGARTLSAPWSMHHGRGRCRIRRRPSESPSAGPAWAGPAVVAVVSRGRRRLTAPPRG
jgi:hypothetical protein